MIERLRTRHSSNAIGTLLVVAMGLLLLGASVIGAAHYHHATGAADAGCAMCLVSATAAAITLPAAVPTAPTHYCEAPAPAPESGPACSAPRRASSRAPPSA